MEIIKKIALILVIIGAINWLMVGLFELDLVATIFGGSTNILAKIVYVLVGISGLISISFLFFSYTYFNFFSFRSIRKFQIVTLNFYLYFMFSNSIIF